MRSRLFQLNVKPGCPVANTKSMLTAIGQAKADGVDLICFPEMAIPGYLLADEWERESFLRECEGCGEKIIEAAQGLIVVFGNVAIDWARKNEDGRVRKYNALFVAENGTCVRHPVTGYPFFIKFLMPDYREFDDHRHFYDPRKLADFHKTSVADLIAPAITSKGKLGCVLCEDGWDEDYNFSPLTLLAENGADILINISSSPYTFDKNRKRHRVFSKHARELKKPLYYVNCCGLQDNGKTLYTFDGRTCAYDAEGHLMGEVRPYAERYLDCVPGTNKGNIDPGAADTIASQFTALTHGISTFIERVGVKKVVVGVSGGIDSAVSAALFRHLLPPEQLLLVSMPGPFSSATTRHLAQELAQNLDCLFTEISIGAAVDLSHQQISNAVFTRAGGGQLRLKVTDFVMENIQARDRSSRILAGTAAAFGGAFTCNANKSELTVGYSTLYGDLGGFIACLGDLWKTEVYELAQFINDEVYGREVIPSGTIDIVPSAELSVNHSVDEGKGDPIFYPYHDRLFQSWVERWNRATPEDNLRWFLEGKLARELAYEGDLQQLFPDTASFVKDLERWWNLYQGMAIAKRIQAPPILALKRRAFGFDHRESQLGPRYTTAYQQLKAGALAKSQDPKA